jgi:hypothetical protein
MHRIPLSKIFYHKNLIFKNSLENWSRAGCPRAEKLCIDTSGEVIALHDQYFELQFHRNAMSDESWFCYLLESESMYGRLSQDITPGLIPGFLIQKVTIMAFSHRLD